MALAQPMPVSIRLDSPFVLTDAGVLALQLSQVAGLVFCMNYRAHYGKHRIDEVLCP
ncbi:hypothetical protein PF005_g723 [Phytophthora fragariae]|uniref:Uncharacterized protein n=1 Tax=Phytophthora fragariae TaxID=53985 RepID=A0A6A3UXX7_9STRA|nr:hypothetical protein PF009_g347 [Phytophthora fragariae]KAE9140243.1 hypothetical protein PF010_g262 [Phytophthora fragariae]KAE9141353.1 hypothetical protein PF007_g267 [Phytophthora fragariae]KAE9155486.1 hypothetical protein PF006_g575 [Phytophthora fragariae]KAE9237287.1 hypothetical protein PF005_g723 [Phytophthora fragariae]